MYRRFYILSMIFCIISTAVSASGLDIMQDTTKALEKNLVDMPFNKIPKDLVASDINVINVPELLKFDTGAGVLGLLQGRVPGLVGQNLRGLGDALIVIDGIPRPLSSVNVHEIEDITVLKDANAAVLYGTSANNGVILIKTKRGQKGRKQISATFEYGFSKPISFPTYLGSAEYMELYNEALTNDGRQPLYNEETITKTRQGLYPTRYPDMDLYNSGFLKDYKPSSKFVGDFSGGTEKIQYYLNMEWYRTGSLLVDKNPSVNGKQRSDRLSIRSNIDLEVSDFIRAYVDISGAFYVANSLPGDFFGDASSLRPNAYSPLIDTSFVINKDLLMGATLIDGQYLLGGSLNYQNNPYGYMSMAGHNKQQSIDLRENAGLIVDLGEVLEGLSAKANMSIDYNTIYGLSVANTYAVYEPNWASDDVLNNLTKIGVDATSGVQNILEPDISRKTSIFASIDYRRILEVDHSLSTSVIAYADKYNETGVFQATRHSHLGAHLNYAYKDKYIVNFNSALPYSPKLASGKRFAFSPTLALAWNLSEENFMKDYSAIDLLTIRASGGIIHTDVNIPATFVYDDIWNQGGGIQWYDSSRGNSIFQLLNAGNPLLFYEKRKEMNIGINALLFNGTFDINTNYFQEYKGDLVTTLSNLRPIYLGSTNPYDNFGENRYRGLELGLGWRKSFGDFKVNINSDVLFVKSEVLKVDELWGEDYLYRAGRPLSAVFGLEALGFFENHQDIENSPDQSSFGTTLQPGDIKYKDQNNDGIIDVNDQVEIAKSAPYIMGSLPIRIEYKDFSLFAMGSWQIGASSSTQSPYYWLFGDRKYSELARERWTPETSSTSTYPRLSSVANNNNFQTSTFWMYDNSRFSIDRVQLGYSLSSKLIRSLPLESFNLHFRASNIALFSKHREKMQLSTGYEPSYRFYAIGFTAQF